MGTHMNSFVEARKGFEIGRKRRAGGNKMVNAVENKVGDEEPEKTSMRWP